MRKIRSVPGFHDINSELQRSLEFGKESLLIKINSAKKLAANLIEDCIANQRLKKILSAPLFSEEPTDCTYDILGDEMPDINFLEHIILTGIQQSQNPSTNNQTAQAFVGIKKCDIEGYTPGKTFFAEFETLSENTGGFIKISPFSTSTRTDVFIFSFNCNFMQEFPKG